MSAVPVTFLDDPVDTSRDGSNLSEEHKRERPGRYLRHPGVLGALARQPRPHDLPKATKSRPNITQHTKRNGKGGERTATTLERGDERGEEGERKGVKGKGRRKGVREGKGR